MENLTAFGRMSRADAGFVRSESDPRFKCSKILPSGLHRANQIVGMSGKYSAGLRGVKETGFGDYQCLRL